MKGPASQFYWSDWLRCAELRICSPEARGIWVDMLAYMHQAKPYGHLIFNDKKVDAKMLSKMTGVRRAVVNKCLKELEDNGVYSVDENGVIYCRRMVRDELKREAWKNRQNTHRERSKEAEEALTRHSDVTPESRDSHADVTGVVTPPSPRSAVLPYFPSSKQTARGDPRNPQPTRVPHRWWMSERGMVEAGKVVGIEARIGELPDSFKRRIEVEIARRKRDGDAPPPPPAHTHEGGHRVENVETLDD